MTIRKIFNADDFGVSKGVNAAIYKAYTEGVLNSTSLMINQKYAKEAIELSRKMENIALGLHVNITNETPAANPKDIPLLVNGQGKFCNGFVNYFLLSIFKRKELIRQVEIEVRAQIEKYLKNNLVLEHIDSHRHVHMIPALFNVFLKLKDEYKISRIRVMNENVFNTIKYNKNKSFWFDGALIKYFILRFLVFLNGYKSNVYFYTMLYTCNITKQCFNNVKIPQNYTAVEVMFHPSITAIDKENIDDIWDMNVISNHRDIELQTLLDKETETGIN